MVPPQCAPSGSQPTRVPPPRPALVERQLHTPQPVPLRPRKRTHKGTSPQGRAQEDAALTTVIEESLRQMGRVCTRPHLYISTPNRAFMALMVSEVETPYDQLKSVLLQRIEASERSRCQQLLSDEELGERRPSKLLRRMIQLLGEGANDIDAALLQELFLHRLPTNVQIVFAAAAPLDLAGLAWLADAVMELPTQQHSRQVTHPAWRKTSGPRRHPKATFTSSANASNKPFSPLQDVKTPIALHNVVGAQHLAEQTTTALTETAHHAHVAASVLARGQKTDN
ncbi:hypothetical protein HPB47_024285 [Ixodes persulcatus]|uniref:Uncharacterized protein n=1 Tax=Ixodes persulcatus TaxID=34615 RepID=A0AC60Q5V9_IXOPE|nr:hypothetical protein HPB47_024285 [Ixodes persulcatus]